MIDIQNMTDDQMERWISRQRRINADAAGNPELDENLRLWLQYTVDEGGRSSMCPMVLADSQDTAVTRGFARRIDPPGGSGVVEWDITPAGRAALVAANEKLGSRATRYVWGVKRLLFREICYGWPFARPLSDPTRTFDGHLCAEQRPVISFIKRILA